MVISSLFCLGGAGGGASGGASGGAGGGAGVMMGQVIGPSAPSFPYDHPIIPI